MGETLSQRNKGIDLQLDAHRINSPTEIREIKFSCDKLREHGVNTMPNIAAAPHHWPATGLQKIPNIEGLLKN